MMWYSRNIDMNAKSYYIHVHVAGWRFNVGCLLERVTGEEIPLDPRFYAAVEEARGTADQRWTSMFFQRQNR